MNEVSPFAPRSIATTDIIIRMTPRAIRQPKLEHVPVEVYHLLRRLAQGPLALRQLHGVEIEAAIGFLVSRELARRLSGELVITPGGRRIGQVPHDTGLGTTEVEEPSRTSAGLKRWLR